MSVVSRLFGFCTLVFLGACATPQDSVDFRTYDIESLQILMQRGDLSSKQLVQFYLDRIESVDRNGPGLNAIIEVNPDAIDIAVALDEERKTRGPRGPMHGIPVVLKANIDTADQMFTTAGSLALADHRPLSDAFVVGRLREAGAVILAKANLSEWANFRSDHSSSGWSSVGGQTRNPYDLRRNPCGSSSGSAVAVAASLTSVAVGTETDGSIVCPASVNGVVGVKPTLGLVSRSGIIPIAHSQDTAGPMGRTVTDAAILLTAMVAADPSDPITLNSLSPKQNYAENLSKDALAGVRVGVLRSYYGAGEDARVEQVLTDSIATLRAVGAEIVDPVKIDTDGLGAAESTVLYYEFKTDLNLYLKNSGASLQNLGEIIAFNNSHVETVMPFFGQEVFLVAQSKGGLDETEYLDALEISKKIAMAGIDDALQAGNIDVLIAPTGGPAWLTDHINGDAAIGVSSSSLAAVSGYASITVPAGFVAGLPIGLSFIGTANSDANLIRFAYAFEQAAQLHGPQQECAAEIPHVSHRFAGCPAR